jgi:hypothetical protein
MNDNAIHMEEAAEAYKYKPEVVYRKDHDVEAAEYDFQTIASREAVKQAKLRGLDLVLPADNQLQIDIDSEAALATFNKNLPKFELHFAKVINKEIVPSKSGDPNKMHITLTLNTDLFDTNAKIAFQAFLGSDPTRELLSYVRWSNNDEHPTLFYEKKRLLLTEGN